MFCQITFDLLWLAHTVGFGTDGHRISRIYLLTSFSAPHFCCLYIERPSWFVAGDVARCRSRKRNHKEIPP